MRDRRIVLIREILDGLCVYVVSRSERVDEDFSFGI